MSTSDNDRIAYLSGEPVASLSAQDRAELDELRTLLSVPATWEEPGPRLEDLVVDAVAREAAEAKSAPRPRLSLRERFRRPSFAFGALAAAAAAVIAVVVVLSVGGGSDQLRFAMVVSGTSLAPGAHGSAEATKTASGWQIQLSATGLPHLENGRFYQAWLKNAAGILVPIGTFNDARHVTLWSGVPVTQFRTLTVTTQQANGNPASSGRRVLIGTITAAH